MAAKEEPSRAEIPYLLGRSYLDMSNNKIAAGFFEKAIALDSTKVNWIYEAGLVFYAVPDYKKSLTYIELAGAKGYKKTNDYLENLGNAYINVKEYDKGIAVLQEVMKRKPSDQELIYKVAQAYFKAKKYQEAIDTWDIVLGLDKTNANVLYMIGLSYQKKGEKQKGQQLCDKAIEMDPSLNSLRQKQDMGMGL
jgi:tetratricopeptide (TPR) repeat protein